MAIDRRLEKLIRDPGEPRGAWGRRGIDASGIRNRLADIADVVERSTSEQRRPRGREPWGLVALGLSAAVGMGVLWLVLDSSRREQVERRVDELRNFASDELHRTLQRGQTAIERAVAELPPESHELRRLLHETSHALEEASAKLDRTVQP